MSKEWSNPKEQNLNDLRKTTNTLVTGSPKKAMQGGPPDVNRQTMQPERDAINNLGKKLMRMSLDLKVGTRQNTNMRKSNKVAPTQL